MAAEAGQPQRRALIRKVTLVGQRRRRQFERRLLRPNDRSSLAGRAAKMLQRQRVAMRHSTVRARDSLRTSPLVPQYPEIVPVEPDV